MESNACDNCNNDCDDKAKACGATSFATLDTFQLVGCYKDWNDCKDN